MEKVEEEAALPTEPSVEAYRTLCSHYTRGCSFVSPCCGKVYPCRLCHNEKEATHEIDRYKVSEVVCRKCSKRQPTTASCVECGISFGRYYCSVCHLYADEDKQQFHCDKCGLCRVGGRENFFHCDTCGYCLSLTMRNEHVCRKQASRDNCPVCMEDLHTSRSAIHPTDCGHLLHRACYTEMLQQGLYQCPQCQRSIADMSGVWKSHDEEREAWQMPLHLRNFKVKVHCRDCLQETETHFHVVGFKCGSCGSYNTVRCGNEEIPEDEAREGGEGEELQRNVLLDMVRMVREMRWRRREEREGGERASNEEESDEEDTEPPARDGEVAGADPPPHHPQTDQQSYEGDEGQNESGASNAANTTPAPAATARLHAEPESDRGTTGLHTEPEPDQATAGSSSGQEWPMSLPVALDDSLTLSDSHSLHSDSSWETEETEVIIGGDPANLPANEPQRESEEESWDIELGDGGATETMATGPMNVGQLRNHDAYDAHIRLDQNGTTSDEP